MKKAIKNIDITPVCQNLKTLRERLGFDNIKDFAKELGLNYTTYRNYETSTAPQTEFLYFLKNRYKDLVDLNWLLQEHDDQLSINNVFPIHSGYELADMLLEKTNEKIDAEGKRKMAEALRKAYDERDAQTKVDIINEIGPSLIEILKT